MPRFVITLTVPAAPGAVRPQELATRLDAGLLRLRGGQVRGARLASRSIRGVGVTRVKAEMTVTAPGMAAALATALDALAEAIGPDAAAWDVRGASAEVRPAPAQG